MAAPVSLSPGSVFAGDYRIERPLAEGGMGAVYIVQQVSTGARRALKVMHPTLAPDAKSRARFVEEARVGARIKSDHVVDVLAAGVDEPSGIPWLVMELLEGGDLEQVVRTRGALPAAEVLDLLQQVAHALGAAHQLGIIHRDLKPENLFLAQTQRRGSASLVKILDFGIARMVEGNRTAATVTSAIGSPLWMAPEQAQPGAKLRASTDVWALGLIGFYLLTGRSYWRAANHPEFNLSALLVEAMTHPIEPASARAAELGMAVPAGFDSWFLRCVDRDPMQRFADANVAIEALGPALSGATHAPARPVAPTAAFGNAHTAPMPPGMVPQQPAAPTQRRTPIGWIIAGVTGAAALALAMAVMVGVVAFGRGGEDLPPPAASAQPVSAASPVAAVDPVAPEPAPTLAPEPEPEPEPEAEPEPEPEPPPARESGRGHSDDRATGGLRSRDPRTPAVRPGSSQVRGSLSQEIIRRVIRRHTGEIRACYERGLLRNPNLAGRVTVSFIISPTGAVQSARVQSSTLGDAGVESCVTSAVRRWTFPAPDGGGIVAVNYPFVLSSQ